MKANEPQPKATTGVVIVAYNSSGMLGGCIAGILLSPSVEHVVVVDNSRCRSTAETVEHLMQQDHRISYISPPSNLGFAAGCNLGAATIPEVDYLFFVNPDAHLERPLEALITVLAGSNAAIVAGRLVTPSNVESHNARAIATLKGEIRKGIFGSGVYKLTTLRGVNESVPLPVGQVDGALLGISAYDFNELGGFDERFELYYEDVDLCRRAIRLGGCLYLPTAWGTHVGGASSETVSSRSYGLSRISRIRYLRKFYGDGWPVRLFIAVIASSEFLVRTLTNQKEGLRTRTLSYTQQMSELRTPGSVQLLP